MSTSFIRGSFVKCPHCGYVHEDTSDYESWWEEGLHETECESCEASFSFETHILITFTSHKPVPVDGSGKQTS